MLDVCNVKCTTSISATLDEIIYTVEEGVIYRVEAHPIDKSKWYIIFPGIKWVLFDKWAFDYIITSYAKHKAYGDFQLPIITLEGLCYVVVTPYGQLSLISIADVILEGKYSEEQFLNCGEILFTTQRKG
jgi:hypothetical protein